MLLSTYSAAEGKLEVRTYPTHRGHRMQGSVLIILDDRVAVAPDETVLPPTIRL